MWEDRFDILLIGHLDKGRIKVGSRMRGIAGGAIYFAGMVYLALGFKVGIVTRLAREDLELTEGLKKRGGHIFPVFTPQTTAIDNLISEADPNQRRLFLKSFAGTFRPEDLPSATAKLFHIATIAPNELDYPFLKAVAERGPVALDAQGLLRRKIEGDELITSSWTWAERGLPLIQYLKVDEGEALALTGKEDFLEALKALGQMGPREIVLTHHLGVIVLAGREVYQANFRPKSIVGRSGRGDTCFAAYLGRRLIGDNPHKAIKFAAALTTLKMEQPGPFCGKLEDVWKLMESV